VNFIVIVHLQNKVSTLTIYTIGQSFITPTCFDM